MSRESLRVAGWLLVILPTVMFGGVSLLRLLVGTTEYMANPLRQDLWRAGHAHAGVFLVLGLVTQLFVDATTLSGAAEWVARSFVPAAALLLPGGFFLSVTRPGAERPNRLVVLVPIGAVVLAIGLVTLGIGLLTA